MEERKAKRGYVKPLLYIRGEWQPNTGHDKESHRIRVVKTETNEESIDGRATAPLQSRKYERTATNLI